MSFQECADLSCIRGVLVCVLCSDNTNYEIVAAKRQSTIPTGARCNTHNLVEVVSLSRGYASAA